MRRLVPILLMLTLTGCALPKGGVPGTGGVTPEPLLGQQSKDRQTVTPPPDPANDTRPDLTRSSPRTLSRDEVRDGLIRLMNEPGGDPVEKLKALVGRPEYFPVQSEDIVPWLEADLNGDGNKEFVLTLAVTDPGTDEYRKGHRAALFVIYRQNGRYEVDRTDRMSDSAEDELMDPLLHAVADLVGDGRKQIVWFRPREINNGPQPFSVFVTEWKPGSFTHLPGEMVISSTPSVKVAIEGKDVVLTGGSRSVMFIRGRTDRYRYVDGAFRLVDRRFVEPGEYGYDRLWDGVVAEAVGRSADAERDYRAAMDRGRKAHQGFVPRYHAMPRELSPKELEAFGEALRTFALFRLGGVLMTTGRKGEALELLKQNSGPFSGLTDAIRHAESRKAGCQAATVWATANPDFLAALNRGVGHSPWESDLLCSYMRIEDNLDRWN